MKKSRVLGPRLLPLFAVTLAGVSGSTLIPPAIPAMAGSLGVAPSTATLLISVYTLPGIVVAPLVGALADRFGRKAVLVPALLLQGLGGGMCYFAQDFSSLLAFRFVQGIGSAGLVNLVVVILGDVFEGLDRARVVGYNAAVLTFGATSFPALGGLLAARGWRYVFAPFWLVLLVAVAVAVVLPNSKSEPRSVSGTSEPAGVLEGMRRVLGLETSRRLMMRGFVLFVLIFGGVLATVPLMLERRFGASPALIGAFLTTGAVASMLASAAGGRLRRRFEPPVVLSIAFPLYVAGMAVLAFSAQLGWLAPGLVGMALCGLGEGTALVLLQTRATETAPPGLRGTTVAVFVSSARLGQTTGPILAKAAIDRLGFVGTLLGFAGLASAMAATQFRRLVSRG